MAISYANVKCCVHGVAHLLNMIHKSPSRAHTLCSDQHNIALPSLTVQTTMCATDGQQAMGDVSHIIDSFLFVFVSFPFYFASLVFFAVFTNHNITTCCCPSNMMYKNPESPTQCAAEHSTTQLSFGHFRSVEHTRTRTHPQTISDAVTT